MTPLDRPDLSVVIASYNASATVSDCLESLRRQQGARRFEVILVDSGTDGTADLVRRRFPEVRLLSFSDRKFCGDARNLGIAEARADIVAFLDADCTAAEDWVDRILVAHASPRGAIGGSIANRRPSNTVGWAAYFLEFSQWMPGGPEGETADVAGANMSYKTGLLAEVGPFVEGTYCSDTEFHWRMAERGRHIWFEPSIRVAHRGPDRWPIFLRHEFLHGFYFGRMRCGRLTRGRRALHALGFPLLPPVLFWRIAARNASNPVYRTEFVRASGALLPGLLSWSLGESLGYLLGRSRR